MGDSSNDDQLDNTLPLSQEGDTFLRNRVLQTDIDAGHFDILLQPNKRTDKNKQLKHELFDFTIYLRNQCGFSTYRPLYWMQQIENYVSSTEDVNSVVHYKWMKNTEKYQTSVINISYQTTRKVTITINFLTGVFMVKGENFKHWIETEAKNVDPSLDCTNDDTTAEKGGTDVDDEVSKQIQSLWHDNEANKVSIESIDSAQRELRDEIRQYLHSHAAAVDDVANIYSEIKRSDDKMATFMQTTEESCKQTLKEEMAKLNKRIDKMFEKFSELKTNIDDRIDRFVEKYNNTNENINRIVTLRDEIEQQKKEIHDVIEGYKSFQACNTEEEFESPTRKKLAALKHDFEVQKTELSHVTNYIKKLEQENDEFRRDVRETYKHHELLNNDALQSKLAELEGYVSKLDQRNVEAPSVDASMEFIEKKVQELLNNNTTNRPLVNDRRKMYEGRDIDVVFCMDSNSKYVRFKKLWTVKNTIRRRCYTQQGLKKFIAELEATSIGYFLIHVGVNDIDHMGSDEVFAQLTENIETLKEKYPNIKIVLAELTPRKDNKNTEVDKCNTLINQFASAHDNIFIANHATIREKKNDFLVDNKHIARKSIGVFVVNLKKAALCEAHGIPYLSRAEYEQKRLSEENARTTV